jgi:hypothetical protein
LTGLYQPMIIKPASHNKEMVVTTVSILAVPNDEGGHFYQAIAGSRFGGGKTPGEALDAIRAKFDTVEASTLVVLQNHLPDRFFTAEQRGRLEKLMSRWRAARETGTSLAPGEQAELDALVDAELRAAGKRAEAMADELTK